MAGVKKWNHRKRIFSPWLLSHRWRSFKLKSKSVRMTIWSSFEILESHTEKGDNQKNGRSHNYCYNKSTQKSRWRKPDANYWNKTNNSVLFCCEPRHRGQPYNESLYILAATGCRNGSIPRAVHPGSVGYFPYYLIARNRQVRKSFLSQCRK